MKYLMLVIEDRTVEPGDEAPLSIEEWVDETYGAGKATDGDRLRPASETKTVRRRRGRTIVTDGPFAEAREWIGGYDILECDSLEEAVEIASRHPMATHGLIEVRQVWPLDL